MYNSELCIFSVLRPYCRCFFKNDNAPNTFRVKMHNQNHWIYIIEAAPPKKRKAKAAPIKRGKQHHTNEVRTGRQQRPKGERGESNTTKKGGLEDQTKIHRNAIHFCEVSKNVFHYILHFLKKKKRTKRARDHHPKEEGTAPPTKEEEAESTTTLKKYRREGGERWRKRHHPHVFLEKREQKKNKPPKKTRFTSWLGMGSVFVSVCFLKMFFKNNIQFLKKRGKQIFFKQKVFESGEVHPVASCESRNGR